MNIKYLFLSVALSAIIPAAASGKQKAQQAKKTPADYVNPFVGTDGFGNVYPGAQLPFGGIQISPDTDEHYYDCASGYKWNRNSIQDFSLTHLSGTGIPDLGDFLFMPGVGEPKLEPGTDDKPNSGYRSRFSHEEETAQPEYYAVTLKDPALHRRNDEQQQTHPRDHKGMEQQSPLCEQSADERQALRQELLDMGRHKRRR